MDSLQRKALRLGGSELRPSRRATKKWAVLYEGKWINFGATGYQDFTDHRDPARRANYRRRHGAIKLKDGRLAYTVPTSPAFWSYNLHW